MSLSNTVLRILNEYGAAASLVRNSGNDDYVSGISDETASTSSFPLMAIQESDKRTIEARFGVVQRAQRVYLINAGQEPEPGDHFTQGPDTFEVKEVSAIAGRGGLILAYYVLVKK